MTQFGDDINQKIRAARARVTSQPQSDIDAKIAAARSRVASPYFGDPTQQFFRETAPQSVLAADAASNQEWLRQHPTVTSLPVTPSVDEGPRTGIGMAGGLGIVKYGPSTASGLARFAQSGLAYARQLGDVLGAPLRAISGEEVMPKTDYVPAPGSIEQGLGRFASDMQAKADLIWKLTPQDVKTPYTPQWFAHQIGGGRVVSKKLSAASALQPCVRKLASVFQAARTPFQA